MSEKTVIFAENSSFFSDLLIINILKMRAINIKQERKTGFEAANCGFIAEKKQFSDKADFLKGTISGEELVKYVCDKLDEKYAYHKNHTEEAACIERIL